MKLYSAFGLRREGNNFRRLFRKLYMVMMLAFFAPFQLSSRGPYDFKPIALTEFFTSVICRAYNPTDRVLSCQRNSSDERIKILNIKVFTCIQYNTVHGMFHPTAQVATHTEYNHLQRQLILKLPPAVLRQDPLNRNHHNETTTQRQQPLTSTSLQNTD